MTGQIRLAVEADLPVLTDIYNQAIATGLCTCDTRPFTPEERQGWFDSHQTPAHPLWVYQEGGRVLGYLCLSPYREGRPALAQVAEVSYYLDLTRRRQGLGTRLLSFGMDQAARLGHRQLLAILLSCNKASIALATKHGFAQWGCLPGAARLPSGIQDHLIYGRAISTESEKES